MSKSMNPLSTFTQHRLRLYAKWIHPKEEASRPGRISNAEADKFNQTLRYDVTVGVPVMLVFWAWYAPQCFTLKNPFAKPA